MRCTEILMEEHDLILTGLDVLGAVSRRLAQGEPPPHATIDELLDFFRDFADLHHHAKEEGLLFPAMEAAGLPHDAGPVGIMLQEHAQGRQLVGVMREALAQLDSSTEARRRFIDASTWYRDHLAQHIQKENQVLFRLAEQVLSPEEGRQLDEAFEQHAAARAGDLPVHFHAVLHDLHASVAPA
jgi:hemerythrin-like domain-containing protein